MCHLARRGKIKPHSGKLVHTAGAYPKFCSTKPTRSIATLPGWNASPSQVTPQHFVAGTRAPFARIE